MQTISQALAAAAPKPVNNKPVKQQDSDDEIDEDIMQELAREIKSEKTEDA
jgi:hypothetical protein